MNEPNVQVGIFYVRKEDWALFLHMMEDSTINFSTWENWKISVDQTKVDLFNKGIDAVEVVVDLGEFEKWCNRKSLPLNADSRSHYAAKTLQQERT